MDTYRQIHRTLRREIGPASEFTCDCGEPAYEWAYQFTGNPELRDENGSGPHSLDPADYAPMCRKCHAHFDEKHDPEMARKVRQGATAREAKYATDPELLERVREAQRKSAQKNRRCNECGHMSSPGGMANHQIGSGHQGWTQEEGEQQ